MDASMFTMIFHQALQDPKIKTDLKKIYHEDLEPVKKELSKLKKTTETKHTELDLRDDAIDPQNIRTNRCRR